MTAPNMARHPGFARARLHEAVVGPADVLYLPAWWWHQFEQPFEDAGNVNLWSKDREGTPDRPVCDVRVREHSLSDHLEREVQRDFGARSGVVLEALAWHGVEEAAERRDERPVTLGAVASALERARANSSLHDAAETWRRWAERLPGGAVPGDAVSGVSATAAEVVADYLRLTHRSAVREQRWPDWEPGVEWDLSRVSALPAALRARCAPAPASTPFTSLCK